MPDRLRDRVEQEANRVLRERVGRIRSALEKVLTEMGEPLAFPLTPGEWGAAGGTALLHTLRESIELVASGSSQRDILTATLDAAAAFCSRTALFILKEGKLVGWAGLGFLGEGGFGNADLPKVVLPLTGDHLLARAAETRAAVGAGSEGPGQKVVRALGGVKPRGACATPLLVGGRPAGVLYGDTGTGEEAGQPDALDIMARAASMAMDRLTATQAFRGRGGLPASPPASKPAARPPAPAPPEDAEIQALISEIDSHPRRIAGDDGLSEEARRMLGDARRFAKLLVSELLLYNEEAVVQGRKNRDLYSRLQKEIDRSRQAYQSRVTALSPGSTDFFQDELVRVLAKGDPGILGN